MPSVQKTVMSKLYGKDVWAGFRPLPANAEVQGWNGIHPSLSRLSGIAAKPIVVDVGVWKGQSTITLASAMKEAGIDGCVIAVDTFLGSPEHWTMQLFSREHGMPDLYNTFMSNVYHADVSDYIVPMPQTSVTAASILRSFGIKASIVHIDAAHEYPEVMRDAEEYWQVLESGGQLIGDDYDDSWPGVVKAAADFSAAKGVEFTVQWPKWLATKP